MCECLSGARACARTRARAQNESLRASRAALAGSGPLTLVLGNEAADLDSIACAASYAALLRDTGDAGALPLVAVPRADLALRADVTWLLRRLGVDAAALPFADEVDARALRDAGRLRAAVLVGAFSSLCCDARAARAAPRRSSCADVRSSPVLQTTTGCRALTTQRWRRS